MMNGSGNTEYMPSPNPEPVLPQITSQKITTLSAASEFPKCINSNTALAGIDHHLAKQITDKSKRGVISEQQLVSGRWTPTPEQLLALEEMYRRGTRTPTADEIQQIASQLRRFGQIEGKNVFYWFQNHKARERHKHKRSRQDTSYEGNGYGHQKLDNTEPAGLRRTLHEVEQTIKFLPLASNSNKHFEGCFTSHEAAMAVNTKLYWRSRFDERGLQHRSVSPGKHAAWQTMACSSFPTIQHISRLIPTTSNYLNSEEHTSLLLKSKRDYHTIILDEDGIKETQTLQLFPLSSSSDDCNTIGSGVNDSMKSDTKVPIATINTSFSPSQFFEFLPLKTDEKSR